MKVDKMTRNMLRDIKPGSSETFEFSDYRKLLSARTQIYALRKCGELSLDTKVDNLTLIVSRS